MITLKNNIIKTDLSFNLVYTNFGPPTKLFCHSAFSSFKPLTSLQGTQFEKHWSRVSDTYIWG
jgi:hypothetical protein